MLRLRQTKIDGIAAEIGPLEVGRPTTGEGRRPRCSVGWGYTFGSLRRTWAGTDRRGAVAQPTCGTCHRMHANIGGSVRSYDKVLVPEINLRPARVAATRKRAGPRIIRYHQPRSCRDLYKRVRGSRSACRNWRCHTRSDRTCLSGRTATGESSRRASCARAQERHARSGRRRPSPDQEFRVPRLRRLAILAAFRLPA